MMKLRWGVIAAGLIIACALAHTGFGQDKPPSAELINKAWSSHGHRDIENTLKYTQQVIDLYKAEADSLQANLSALPKHKDEIDAVGALNDVATAYFIQAEIYMRQNDFLKAEQIFSLIIEKYP
ncbi:MAG: hypothetical protein PHE65_07090, partial [Candidatus Omnitrophica bacterium]|nr:hypothetical protein [Candidatus Omnitrophota bacterium]